MVFCVCLGDIPPHTVWDETPQSQLDCTVALVDLIARNLTGYNVYPIIGNHGRPCIRYFAILQNYCCHIFRITGCLE